MTAPAPKETEPLVLKLILIGDSGVGKSCLLKSFMGDPFKSVYTSTIGVDFEIKPVMVNGRSVNLQIWDTAGQERFRTITTSYYRNADAIMLVFALTDAQSFQHCETWLEDVRLYSSRDVLISLIGNKCDVSDDRAVDHKEAKAYADRQQFFYDETSAKTRVNVERALMKLVQAVYEKKREKLNGSSGAGGGTGGSGSSVTLSPTQSQSASSSCPC